MNYKEKKRSMFFGLPWTFTSYTVTEEIITVDTGLFKKEENDCYLYKVIDVRLESTLLERMLGLGTIHCFTGDVTDPDLKLLHIKHAKDSKEGKGSVDKNSTAFLVVVLINSLRVALMLHSGFGTRKVCKCDVLRNRKSTEPIFDFVLYFFLYE